MNLRPAKHSELNQLKNLEQYVVDAERPFNSLIRTQGAYYYDIEALILSEDALLLVAEIKGDIIATGYAKLRQSKPSLVHETDAYLGFMYVSPDYRGQGLNNMIIEGLISWARDKGVNDFYLDVYAENSAAIKAYSKAGFKSSIVEMKLNL